MGNCFSSRIKPSSPNPTPGPGDHVKATHSSSDSLENKNKETVIMTLTHGTSPAPDVSVTKCIHSEQGNENYPGPVDNDIPSGSASLPDENKEPVFVSSQWQDNTHALSISYPRPECANKEKGDKNMPGSETHLKENEEPVLTMSYITNELSISDSNLKCTKQNSEEDRQTIKQGGPDIPSSLGSTVCSEGDEEMFITYIRTTDLAVGMRRIPFSFYTVVHYNDLEWRTETKCPSADDNVVEWDNQIPVPSDPSAIVDLKFYAIFKSEHPVGDGECVRELEITMERLLDHSARSFPISLFPNDGDVISPCSSLQVTIGRWNRVMEYCPSDNQMQQGSALSQTSAHMAQLFRLLEHYEQSEDLDDLQKVILFLEGSTESNPFLDGLYPQFLDHFANLLSGQFDCHGHLADLEQAILRQREVVKLTLDHHPDKPGRLNRLGNFLFTCFQHLGNLEDLEMAILKYTDAIELTPSGHVDKPGWLNNLGSSYFARFQRYGEPGDLEHAISKQKDAVELTPDSHPDKPGLLNNLGTSFHTRFKRFGDLEDLECAISRQSDAVELAPNGHPDKPSLLNNLGNSLRTRFERLGDLGDLELAISRHKDAVKLIPDGHSRKPGLLNNLGNSFIARFGCLGDLGDLEQAISRQMDANELTPDGHPNKPGLIMNLGNSFRTRFYQVGNLKDLELAILRIGEAVELTPDDHPDKPGLLNNLGTSFITRFERLGELDDLERGISRLGDAVKLTPEGHPGQPGQLSNLGRSFFARFKHLGELSDLERAISRFENAVELTPDDHPYKRRRLNGLGTCYIDRFERLGQLGDLEGAISKQRDAVELTPDGHPDKPILLNNLGSSFFARFQRLEELEDLEQAISRQRDAVELTPDGHPDKPNWLKNLENSFRARFECLGEVHDLERTISLYSRSASHLTGPPSDRFDASLLWVSFARASGHPSLLQAYSITISLLPQLAWIGFSFSGRFQKLIRGADIVRDAAAAALESGYPETAVEWLEKGRSIVWGELLQLRSSYDELFAAYPDDARKLRQLSIELERASTAREKSPLLDVTQSEKQFSAESMEKVASRHRHLAIERDNILQKIRRLPGFERFLLHKQFSQLRVLAHEGPVVILNAAENRCNALIVLADVENVIHVPLPNILHARSEALQNLIKGSARHIDTILSDERKGKMLRTEYFSPWESILLSLWKCVVKPVLESLAFVTPGKPSRIFWCPTGPLTFLPIHAAGLYDADHSQPGYKISDFVVSSYVPTLSILAPSPEPPTPSVGIRFLAVRQPSSDGLVQLPGVEDELEHIKSIIDKSCSAKITLHESSSGTVEEVLDLMKGADWVHFACHGIQDAANPTDSGLCLANGRRLKLSDIIALSRPRDGLAFLSACQTAKGDARLSDEAIHIAAGMLFAGYGGVVGTMWSINDRLAPELAKDVYEQLFSKGTKPDYREAARALQDAVIRRRDSGASFSDWIPFIHVGL